MSHLRKIFSRYLHHKESVFLGFLILMGIVILCISNIITIKNQQYLYLAKSFIEGHLYFTHPLKTWTDSTPFNAVHYWPLGPFPAILLTPIAAIFYNVNFPSQGLITFFCNILNLILLYKIAKKITGNHLNSLWLAWGYVFSSAYLFIAMVPFSWYFAQVIGTTLILLSLYEYFFKKRWILIGIYIGLAIVTRSNLALVTIFYLFIIWKSTKLIKKERTESLFQLLIPVTLALLFLLFYNYIRFGNILDNGYTRQIMDGFLFQNRKLGGLWSLVHFPSNFYYLFLKGPEGVFINGTKILTYPYLIPSYFGMSILFTSPLFLWIFKAPWKNVVVRGAVITALIMLIFTLGLFSRGGFIQYGYRFSLYFYPFLFLLLVYSVKDKVPNALKVVMVISFLINLYFISIMFFNIQLQTIPQLMS